jgi:hypothetical protein
VGAFEYLFSFYGLLAGLAAANVATGFADMWRDRREITVGVCTPLVAAIVLFGTMNLWMSFWWQRELADMSGWRLLSAVGMTLPFVFVSRAIFPREGGATSLEEHYVAHRRILAVALLIAPVVSLISGVFVYGRPPMGLAAVWLGLRILAPVALLAFPDPRAQRGILAAMLVLLVIGLFR